VSYETISLLGYASDLGGANRGSSKGPETLKNSTVFSGMNVEWKAILSPDIALSTKTKIIHQLNNELSILTANYTTEKKFFTVFGGDHSSAIGTWSGVADAKQASGPIGLIWVDAHLDSNTPETSPSGNLHGMPLACLLGYGDPLMTHIRNPNPKLKPENVCMIGMRSYEQGELDLLNKLNVKIFFMDEVKQRGLESIFAEAIQIVTKQTSGYGITIDIDSIDPADAPGTGTPEPDGIRAQQLIQVLTMLANDSRLIGAEIVEFDPSRDKNHITEKLIARMLAAITLGNVNS
jgi:arginase